MKTEIQKGLLSLYEKCSLCPRRCGVNRAGGERGFCGERDELRVGYVGPHFGEEPPLTGENGSGTVFLSGCSLRCSYCQNHQISRQGLGKKTDSQKLALELASLVNDQKVHNINFVTPDHFFPHIFMTISLFKEKRPDIPVIFNVSGYQSTEMLRISADYVDIYLPDFKYSDPRLGEALSGAGDYPGTALDAISEMVHQKGFMDALPDDSSTASRGVLVRHLILPGKVTNSINALNCLFLEFGKGLPLSIMSQYRPVVKNREEDLNRTVYDSEFYHVYNHAMELGFENIFVQFPDRETTEELKSGDFLPDFSLARPFDKGGPAGPSDESGKTLKLTDSGSF